MLAPFLFLSSDVVSPASSSVSSLMSLPFSLNLAKIPKIKAKNIKIQILLILLTCRIDEIKDSKSDQTIWMSFLTRINQQKESMMNLAKEFHQAQVQLMLLSKQRHTSYMLLKSVNQHLHIDLYIPVSLSMEWDFGDTE